jgi:hypothetical protein
MTVQIIRETVRINDIKYFTAKAQRTPRKS